MDKIVLSDKRMEKAQKKLNAAEYLLNGGFYEDAISRGYYAMYHAAKAVLALKDVEPKRHAGVLSMFGLHVIQGEDADVYLGKALAHSKEGREKSDYDEFAKMEKEDAEFVIEEARDFIDKVERVIEKIKNAFNEI